MTDKEMLFEMFVRMGLNLIEYSLDRRDLPGDEEFMDGPSNMILGGRGGIVAFLFDETGTCKEHLVLKMPVIGNGYETIRIGLSRVVPRTEVDDE